MRGVLTALLVLFATATFAQTPKPDKDAAEIKAYRLSLPTLTKVEAATKAYIAAMNADPKYKDLMTADKEFQRLKEKDDRTPADEARMAALKKTLDSNPMSKMDGDSNETLDQLEAEMKQVPPVMAALSANSLTPREYMKCMMVALQATVVAESMKASAGSTDQNAQLGAAMAMGMFGQNLSQENIAFARANLPALERFMQAMQSLNGQQ